jgi:hypothetical protein
MNKYEQFWAEQSPKDTVKFSEAVPRNVLKPWVYYKPQDFYCRSNCFIASFGYIHRVYNNDNNRFHWEAYSLNDVYLYKEGYSKTIAEAKAACDKALVKFDFVLA